MTHRLRLLDLFCGAGGAAHGYYEAGITDITGVDISPQPRYPFKFIQADALQYLADNGGKYDIVHASPPCQAFSNTRYLKNARGGPNLIDATRELLLEMRMPYIIENVPGAPLIHPVMLCGLMFKLRVLRHRLFETYPTILGPYHPPHPGWVRARRKLAEYSSFRNGMTVITACGSSFSTTDASIAMGIDWMTKRELAQAIPPAYTKYIGHLMINILNRT